VDEKKKPNSRQDEEILQLDDDRRVKTLSPGMLVVKRFMRNRLAIIGSVIIIAMFLFSFLGGVLMPYDEGQMFMKTNTDVSDWAFATVTDEVTVTAADGASAPGVGLRGAISSAIKSGADTAKYNDSVYAISPEGTAFRVSGELPFGTGVRLGLGYEWDADIPREMRPALDEAVANELERLTFGGVEYTLRRSGRTMLVSAFGDFAAATRYVYSAIQLGFKADYDFILAAERAIGAGEAEFSANGESYSLERFDMVNDTFVVRDAAFEDVITLSNLSVQPRLTGEVISLGARLAIQAAIEAGDEAYDFDGAEYHVVRENAQYRIRTETDTTVVSRYERPSAAHPLGMDGNGMDVVTRLMYGGRVSLMVGFIVILIGLVLGVIVGGTAGYFGKWIDMLAMRLADIFNCIPTIPLYLIMGSVMEGAKVDPRQRIYILMIIMGVMSWSGIARIVRGQILSLREQEFMVAEEALGIKTSRRIFRHLIPNVIPQMIVWATMGLGDVILAESTLSFLGLGVKYPLASWGNILNAVNDSYVMTSYPYVWIPAGFIMLITVLGFNFVGDGLRDAFDPKAKR